MKAIDIKWDEDCDGTAMLPKALDIPAEITDKDEISDYLSDTIGYCHKGFRLL